MDVVVGLGANLGDRLGTLVRAAKDVGDLCEEAVVASSLYETEPVGPPQPAYLNAAIRLDVAAAPLDFLAKLHEIERRLGRVRTERWVARTIDLDVLWIADTAVNEPDLIVPHPRLVARRFALVPLLDVAPDARHPVTGEPLRRHLDALPAEGVLKVAGPDWIAPNQSPRGSR